jgi:hypothetical protein
MHTFVSPSGREYEWNKPNAPTQADWDELIAYDASLGPVEKKEGDANLGKIAAGVGADIAISTGGQVAGAALAPMTLGISYPVLAFSSGVAGNIASQKIEGAEDISIGRALVGGFANMLPASKAVSLAGRAVSTGVRGAGIAAADEAAYNIIDENKKLTEIDPTKLATKAGFGLLAGAGMEGVFEGGRKIYGKFANKAEAVVREEAKAVVEKKSLADAIDESLGMGAPIKPAAEAAETIGQPYIANPASESASVLLSPEAVAARANRSPEAKQRILQQLIDDNVLADANRAAESLGLPVDSRISELSFNRVMRFRQGFGDDVDAAISALTTRLEKSTPPLPEEIAPKPYWEPPSGKSRATVADEQKTTPLQDTQLFNARRQEIATRLINNGVPAKEAFDASRALASSTDPKEYDLLYRGVLGRYGVSQAPAEQAVKPTKLTALEQLTPEVVGVKPQAPAPEAPPASPANRQAGKIKASLLAPLSTGAAGFATGLSVGETPEERLKNAVLFAAAASGSTVAAQKAASKIGQKITASTEAAAASNVAKANAASEIDRALSTGKIAPADFTPKTNVPAINQTGNGLVEVASNKIVDEADAPDKAVIASKPSGILASISNVAKSLSSTFTPSAVVGRNIRNVAEASRYEVAGIKTLGDKVNREVATFLGRYKDGPARAQAEEAINNFIDRKADKLPDEYKPILPFLELARDKIDELQGKLLTNISTGATVVSDEMRERILNSREGGNYLTREFRWFTDSKYVPSAAKRAAAVKEYGEGGEEFINSLWAKKRITGYDQNQIPSSLDGYLKQKKELGPAMLDYLGEIRDPAERLRGTLDRLARGVFRDESDAAIKSLLKAQGLASEVGGEGLVPLRLRKADGGETQLYVEPHVQNSLYAIYNSGIAKNYENPVLKGLADFYNSGLALAKGVKVLGNISSYPIAAYSNAVSVLAMGIDGFSFTGKGLRIALSSLGKYGTPEFKARLAEEASAAVKYGLAQGNVTSSEIRDSLGQVADGSLSKGVGKVLDPFGKAYSAPDVAARIVVWHGNQKVNRSIFPTASGETIRQFSADVTKDTFQNYDRLSAMLKGLSRLGVLSQFVSFNAEFLRNQYHQGRIIKEMLSGTYGKGVAGLGAPNLKAMREEGGRRMSALLGIYGMTAAGVAAYSAMGGVTKDNEKAIRETAIPDYDNTSPLAIQVKEDGKKIEYFNPSYISPYALGVAAFNAGFSDKPMDSVVDLLKNQFLGEGAFFSRALAAGVSGRNLETGKQISFEADKLSNFLDRASYVMSDAFTPSVAKELTKYAQASEGKGDLSKQDVLLRQAGVRVNAYKTEDSARMKLYPLAQNATGAKAAYVKLLKDKERFGGISQADIENGYNKANSAYLDNLNVAINHANNLRTLKFKEPEIIKVLKDSGFNNTQILSILDNNPTPMPRTLVLTPASVFEDQISILPKNQQVQKIKELGAGNPALQQTLYSAYKANALAEAKGVTSRDELLMSLGVSDMGRAKYLAQYPDFYLRSLSSKGIVTPEVYRQIQLIRKSSP